MKGRPQKTRRLSEKNEESVKFIAAHRRAVGGNGGNHQLCQFDQGFKDALSVLPEFLAPVHELQQPSRFPSYALLSGPPKCGKTSLLLQLAYNLAVDSRARVVFICKRSNFEDDYLYVSRNLDTASAGCERVHIKYIRNDEELRQYFAAFHFQRVLPTAVLVDDFVDFFAQSYERQRFQLQTTGEVSLVKALSLCHNAIEYANSKNVLGMRCRFIISDTHPRDGPRLLYLFKRLIPRIYLIKGEFHLHHTGVLIRLHPGFCFSWVAIGLFIWILVTAMEFVEKVSHPARNYLFAMLELPVSVICTGLNDSRFSLELQDVRTGEMGNIIGRFTLAHQALHFEGLETRSEAL